MNQILKLSLTLSVLAAVMAVMAGPQSKYSVNFHGLSSDILITQHEGIGGP